MNQHPLREFWAKSGWQSDGNNPEDAVSEGKLVIQAWNEAIRIAKREIIDSLSTSEDIKIVKRIIRRVDFMKYDVKS